MLTVDDENCIILKRFIVVIYDKTNDLYATNKRYTLPEE